MNKTTTSRNHLFTATLVLIGLLMIVAVLSRADIVITGKAAVSDANAVEAQWNIGKLTDFIPQPTSSEGYTEIDNDAQFARWVSNTSKETFNTYITECQAFGFTENAIQEENTYYADNADGYHLALTYHENNVMDIRLDAPKAQ